MCVISTSNSSANSGNTLKGATQRRPEVEAVVKAIERLGLKRQLASTRRMQSIVAPATLDGGDVLFTGADLFVGLSRRTNAEALEQMHALLSDSSIHVHGIHVAGGLHLKSFVTAFDEHTIIVSSGSVGSLIRSYIDACCPNTYTFVEVPDIVSSNVVRVRDLLIIQAGYPSSQVILAELAASRSVRVVALDMSELVKADGALTCCSLLLA